MIPEDVFKRKMADLTACLPARDLSTQESDFRHRLYYRNLRDLNVDSFVEACDRIIILDEWFPVVARVREVAKQCAEDRRGPSPADIAIAEINQIRMDTSGQHIPRDPLTGKFDMDAFYRRSRELRNLDPNIDERPAPVLGFTQAGKAFRP